MRALLVCCLLALAVCQESFCYELKLNPKKIYEYQYEGQVKFGLGKPNRAESGARMKSLVRIKGDPQASDSFFLEFSHVVFEELNGITGSSDFQVASQLTEKITEQLSKPIRFTYSTGNVHDIQAPAEVTDTVVNIVRGFLGFFQVTIKTTQDIYELEEIGIHGKCVSSYSTTKNNRDIVTGLTQVVDVTNCREKAAYQTGLATAVEDKISKQKGVNLFSTVKYTYTFSGEEAGVISNAEALELQYFTPFNVKRGSFRMEAKKKLQLLSEKDKTEDTDHQNRPRNLESRGNLMYKVVKNNANIPVVMQKLENPSSKALQLIKRLAQANAQQIDSTTTEETIKLYQLLRMVPQEKLQEMWTELKNNPDERYWFLHTVVEVNDNRILNFLDNYLKEADLNTLEAITVIVQAFNHLEPSSEHFSLAEKLLKESYTNPLIRQTVVLSYGSLVYKHCAYHTPCPESVIKPLNDMADQVYSSNDEMEKILVLKALGNAGHPRSLKYIMRFLPKVDPNHDQVDRRPRVVSAAIQAMRLIAMRDPHRVQQYTLQLFLNRELEAELRMLALMIMFDTKPPMALVSTVTAHLLEERNMQVVNFAYTYMRSLAKATTPDNHYVSIAASVAVKILAPRFGHLNYIQSQARRMDWFDADYLIGTAAEAFILKRASQMIPAEMMVKVNFHFVGRILQLVEFGIRPEGLRDLFGANIPGLREDMSMEDFQAIFDVLKKWETLPEDKPLFSFYTRASGQEFFFSDIHKHFLQRLTGSSRQSSGRDSQSSGRDSQSSGRDSQSASRDSYLWRLIEKLIRGFSWRGVLPFLTAEARFIQATTLGLPVEISKYYHVVSGMAVNAKAGMSQQAIENKELFTSEITLTTDGYIGYTKNIWLFYGINTDLFQSAIEIKTISPVAIPFNVKAQLNVPARKFKLEIPRSSREMEIFSFRSNAYAISRNAIQPEAAKRIPLVAMDQSVTQKYSQVMQKQQPNRWHPVEKKCFTSAMYGLTFCTEMELKREYYQEEYPLYHFLGLTHISLKVSPAQESVDKIRLEINANPSSSSVSVRQVIDALRKRAKEARSSRNSESEEQQDRPTRGSGGSPVPVVEIKVVAESSSSQKGYDALLYLTPEGESQSVQLVLSRIGDSANWRMCVDATARTSKAKAHIGWGAECQNYVMFIRGEHVTGNRPELKASLHWDKVPEYMEQDGRRIASYIPGMAYLLGFYQEEERNVRQEVSVSVIAASADSIDVKIKFPEYTLYREALQSLVPPANFLNSNRSINSNRQ